MPVLDERGRLFGKINLIDAVVVVLVLGLIPLAYGAFLLFRVPKPSIVTLQPTQVAAGQPASLLLTGENLRPFLRARIGPVDSPLFVQNPTTGEIKLPQTVQPGTYDIALFDEGQELARKPGALTVIATERIEMQAVGAFVGLTREDAESIEAGTTFGTDAQVVSVRPPQAGEGGMRIGSNVFPTTALPGDQRIPAILKLTCAVVTTECRIAQTPVARGATISFPLPPRKDKPENRDAKFLIDEVFPADTRAAFPAVATIRARFIGEPGILKVMKVGDVDLQRSPTGVDTARAVLVAVESQEQLTTNWVWSEGVLSRTVQLPQPVVTFIGTIRVPVVFTPSGWVYQYRPIRVGSSFSFETALFTVSGWIVDVKIGEERPGATR